MTALLRSSEDDVALGDRLIADEIDRGIAAALSRRNSRVSVHVRNGTVLLRGLVTSSAIARVIERLAWQTVGVLAVLNKLVVDGPVPPQRST